MALDDLFSAVDEMSDQQKRGERLALSITGAYGGDPDDEATKRRLEKRTGIPSALMDEKVRKDAELQDFVSHPKFQTLPAHSPRTSTYLSSHENASISHDDVEALSGIERAFQVLKRSGRSLAASSASMSAGLWGIPRAAADILHAGAKPLTDLAGLPDYTAGLAEWTSNQQRGAEALAGKIRGSQEDASIFERGIYSGVESLGQNLLMLPITIASGGSATPMLAGMAGSTGGQAFGQAREGGLGVAQSLSFAASQGSIEYVTERIPALRFVEGLQANRTLGKMFKSVLGPDIYGEQIATALQDLNEWAALSPEATLKDYLVERPSAAFETFIATVVGTGGQVAAAKGLQKAGQKVDNYIQAKSQSDFLMSLGDSVKASKTFARLPENVQALVKSIKEDGDVTDIYVPVDDFNKLFQGAKETPMEAATRILSDPARYTDAMVTGSDVAIPVEEFAMLAGSPQYSELARVSRTSPDAMSLAEAEAFEADREGRVNELLRMAEEAAPEDGETAQTAYKKIYDDAYGQLLLIRGHAEAEAGAALRAKGLTTISQRYGLEVDDLLARFPLTVTRGPFPEAIQKQLSFDEQKAQAQLDAMIDRLRKRDIPKEQDIFGPTLAEFLVGKGGLKDQGGELKAMDAAKQRKPFKRSLVQAEGLGFDHARELAVEAGYLPEGADVRDLLDAIDAEFKGQPVYAPGGVNTRMLDEQEALNQFQEYLDMAGIDLAQATNEDVRKILDQQMSRALFQSEANQVGKLQDIVTRLQKQFPEMKLDAFERKGEITINRIVFPKEQRGKGQGSEVFKAITEYADATGQIVTATPSTDFGGTKSRIIAFNKRFGFVENKGKNKDFAISETMYRLPVRALFQGFDDKRAYFDPLLGEIGLLKKADASSFVHELGHYYFEVLDALAKGDNAPEQIKSDMETLFKWIGVENRDQMDVEHYEIFARGFEAYLYEGKAPSPELLGVFQRFKVWMKAVYASLRSLNVELTKDVRDVFDRLLATDDEIEAAREDAGASPIFATAEAAGMKDEQFKAYRKLAEQAHLEARDRLDRQKLKEVTRAKEAWWKVARANMMLEVETESKQEPAYQVLTFIYTGKLLDGRAMDVHRLSGAALAEMYDAPTLAAIRKKLGNIYVNEGGVDPDALADEFGFSSGDEMIKRVMEVPRFREYVSAETDRRMLERYGAMNPVEIAEEAAAAVHNDEQGKLLRAELKALRRKAKEVAPFVKAEKAAAQAARKEVKATIPPVEFFKEAAQRKIARMSLAELTPGIYARAESKASRESFELNGKGKFVEAGEAKQRQLLNHYLYKAAVEAKEEAENIRKFFKKMETPKAQAVLGKAGEEFQTSMNAILEQYEFRKTTKKELDYRASLPGLIERMKGLGRDTEPLESLLMSFKTNYRSMTLAELRDVADAGNFIYHAAKTAEKVRLGEKAIAKDLIRGEVIGSLRANSKGIKAVMESDHGWKKVLKFGRGFIAPSFNADTILFGLDGWERLGPVYRHVKGVIDDSVSNTLMPMQAKNGEVIEKLYSVYSGKELRKMFTARFKVPELNGSFTKEEILSIALNQGNEGNREALVGSALAEQIGLTQEKIAAVLGRHMDERDWKFVQSIWDHVNSFWPEIAEKQRQRTGIVPQKVEATPVVTPFGLIKGGYYPLKFDMSKSINAAEDSAEEFYTSVRNGRFSWAQTSHGHTIERVGSGGRPVLLSLSVLHNHLNQVITDLSLGDAVNYSAFVLNDIQIKTAFEQAGAVEARQYLDIWLSDTAMQERVAGDVFTRTFRRLRTGIAAKSMLFNVGVGLLQVSGIFQTAGTIGINNTLYGVQELLSKPWTGRNNVVDQIYALSPFMAKRDDTFQKDMMDFISSVKSNSARNFVSNYGMWLIKRAQRIVDLATWMGAYKDGLRRYRQEPTDSRAIAYADRMVARAQGSGLFSDRSALERGSLGVDVRQSELVRGFTTLLSYQIAKFNVAREKVGKTDFTDLIQVSELAVDFTLLYVVDAAFTMMLTGIFPGNDEDESWLWKLGKRSASSALAAIPAMRDILAYFEGFNGGGVVGTFGDSLAKAWKQIEQGEIDKPLLKSVNTVGGILFKYPSAAINRFGDALSRDLDGQDVEMIEYFIYQDKGRK